MYKTIKYSTFILASLALVFIFITSKNYTQLTLAAILYPIFIFIAFKLFPRDGSESIPMITIERTVPVAKTTTTSNSETKESAEKVDVNDVDKRAFLKLIGAAGLSFFIMSIFSRKAGNIPFLKKVTGSDVTAIEDLSGNKINPAQTQPTDGYKISEVDDNVITFYGFIRKGGSWFIMREDTENGSFRYAKGDSDFSVYWNSRETLSYDYYSNVF